MVAELGLGDVVVLKKQHPCGGREWRVVRLGADIGLQCTTCHRRILLARSELEKRVRSVRPAEPRPVGNTK
ncbi:MAG: DUF951 domain-containing protein [SAR202 cluster bacterium]|nr:DUF951 domain-containing protein [SAR202 cluster bacterium]